jgi:pimeloyl-ACP methyl ester carboxylesterase
MATKTVLFVHGLFVSYKGWDKWVSYFEEKGYKATAMTYPLRDKSVEELRKAHPDPKLGQLAIQEVIDHLVSVINGLDEKPIIIGHSFGGLLTQLMINRDLGAAGVAIDSVPPMGVLSFKWSFIKSSFPLTNPLNPSSKPYLMPFESFQYAFVNGMPLEEQRKAYDEYVVPESIRLGRGALGSKAKVDFNKPHAPLLFIAGEIDHIIPASLNKSTHNRYKGGSNSITDYKEFPGRNHFGIGASDWQELADYALGWIERHKV